MITTSNHRSDSSLLSKVVVFFNKTSVVGIIVDNNDREGIILVVFVVADVIHVYCNSKYMYEIASVCISDHDYVNTKLN